MKLSQVPNLIYADGHGNVFEEKNVFMCGRSGLDIVALSNDEFIELPEGSDFYFLPDRNPIGFDKKTGEPVVVKKGMAVAVQMSPAHTMLYQAAFQKTDEAETLPLFAYTAIGKLNGKYYVPAVRIDKDIRQEPWTFDMNLVEQSVEQWIKQQPENRLLHHIGNNCALTYKCPAARNFFLNRYEAPIPTSPACNANCIGCISFQPETEIIQSTQDRLTFKPTAEEICGYAIHHLNTVDDAIVSFGQGCEGEPLLMWETIRNAIRQIRNETAKGSININTNGSLPNAVEELCKAGLNSIRVSTNSVRPEIYNAYYLPNNYGFNSLEQSVQTVRKYNGWTSLNYFVFPGVTDEVAEYEALRKFISNTGLNMIQWRNFNIDPDWYLDKINYIPDDGCMGVAVMMKEIKKEFPKIQYGYFNPTMSFIKSILKN